MAIELIKEPEELSASFLERCCFCNLPTPYWHEKTNNPVCPTCASAHEVSEIPVKK